MIYLNVFAGMATYYQPTIPGMPTQNQNADEDNFEKWARLAIECAAKLAPYQSPTFRAVVVGPAPDANQPEKRKRFTLSIFDGSKLGAPKIRVVDCKDYYMAIEGCHRLMAASELGIAPCLTVLDREDTVEVDSLDTDYFPAGTTRTAGAFADAFRDPEHNPVMIINPDGTLTVVDLTAEEEE